jgi:glycosyltransferase involved in cell wall biosynthesis
VIELSVVLPVYNEPSIEKVVREAAALVDELAPGAGEVIVVNDGSTDGTGLTVDALAGELTSVRVLHQVPNQGHGPALIRGFDEAAGHWIGHLDTDDQIPTAELGRLWAVREGQDLVLGNRLTRHDPRHRLVLTAFVRVLVRVLAGRAVKDANVPCKLFTRELWSEVRPVLPADTFAPSLALVILASRWRRPVRTVDVAHRPRSAGNSSLHPARLASVIALATRQTVRVAVVAVRTND